MTLVSWLAAEPLTDEGLELASTSWITSKVMVGLKTEFSSKRGLNFTLVGPISNNKY